MPNDTPNERPSGEANDEPLASVRRFHAAIAIAQDAGVRIEFGDGVSTPHRVRRQLQHFEQVVSDLVVHSSDKLNSAIQQQEAFPSRYRIALLRWLHSPDSPEALDILNIDASSREELRHWHRLAWVQPIVLGILCLLVLVNLLLVSYPQIEAVYRQTRTAPGAGMMVLASLNQHLWWWLPLGIVVLVVVSWVLFVGGESRNSSRGRLGRGYLKARRGVMLAEQAEHLVKAGCSRGQAAEILAAEMNQDVSRIRTDLPSDEHWSDRAETESLGEVVEEDVSRGDSTSSQQRHSARISKQSGRAEAGGFPVLLQWALTTSLEGGTPSQTLRFARLTYERVEDAYREALQHRLPVKRTALVGGFMVGGLALALFLPIIDLLMAIIISR